MLKFKSFNQFLTMFSNCLVWIISLFIAFGLSGRSHAVKINQLIVPEVVPANTPIILDCDYSLNDANEDNLVVKWYFDDNILVYQWIVGRQPISLDILRKRVDLNYTVNSNPKQLHRALKILNPTTDLTGNYTCAVSSLTSEDSQKKQMIVLVRPSSFEVEHEFLGSSKYEIRCVAKGVFPIPNLTLRLGHHRILKDTTVNVIPNNNTFDVTAKATVYVGEGQVFFTCLLTIPQTAYSDKKNGVVPTFVVSTGYKTAPSHLLGFTILTMTSTSFYW